MSIKLPRQIVGLPLLLSLLAGCATATPSAMPTAPASEPAAPIDAVTPPAEDANYPKQALTPELLFGFLIGDVAASTGNRTLAADTWLELARRTRDPRAARRALELSFSAGKADNALQAARLWRELEPANPAARHMLLSVLARTNQTQAAEAELDSWLSQRPGDAPAVLMQLGNLWPSQVEPKAALAIAQRQAERFPALPEAAMALSFAARKADDQPGALAAADEAIRRKPDWEEAILYRASLVETASAIDYLQAANRRLPKSRAIKSALAAKLTDAKRYEAGLALYTSLASDYPAEVEYLVGQALCAMQLRRYADATAPLERALQLGVSKPAAIHYYLGLVGEEQGKLDMAREHYSQIIDSDQGTQAIIRLSRIEARSGNREAALALISKLPDQTPEEQVSRIQIEAQTWRELKDIERAQATLDQGLIKHVDNAELLYDRSLIFDLKGDLPAAERDLRRYLQLKPDSAIALNALGYTLANRSNRFDEAEALLSKALTQEPDNPVIIDSMGWLQYRRGNLDEAVKWLGKAFANLPDPEIAAHYGEALWRAGKQSEARKIWAEGKKLDPAHEVLSETVQRLTGQ